MPGKGTPRTTVRLTDQDKADIATIRERYGSPDATAAIRYALRTIVLQIQAEREEMISAARRKISKKSQPSP